jgi:antitoxin (DNA-binding transcriptional repressor) of toxin-antitoxin stability system
LSNIDYSFYVVRTEVDQMKTLGVGEIKARFADVLERVKSGEKIAVGYGKKRKKVAVIVPYDGYQPRGQRKLGPLLGKAQFEVLGGFKSDEDLLAS